MSAVTAASAGRDAARAELARKVAIDREASARSMFIDGRLPSQTLDAIARLLRGLPAEIEGADVGEELDLALCQIDAARAAVELHLEHKERVI